MNLELTNFDEPTKSAFHATPRADDAPIDDLSA
jgi:hypothetical protein